MSGTERAWRAELLRMASNLERDAARSEKYGIGGAANLRELARSYRIKAARIESESVAE